MPQKAKQDTPAMRQYHRFKEQHPGCLLLFRMGDFYELFFDDAVTAHQTLGVTLTQRTEGVPMAGVPYHAVETYLRRLIAAGHRVAVCDQVEDAKQAKASGGGVVKRDVTRVITPGTLTDETLLDAAAENPLAAVAFHSSADDPDGTASLAWCELSTGRFALTTLPAGRVGDELARITPSELLYCDTATGNAPPRVQTLADRLGCPLTGRPPYTFRPAESAQILKQQYRVKTLQGFGLTDEDPAVQPAGAVLHYLRETQRTDDADRLAHLHPPKRFDPAQHLVIDATSLASLEVLQTLRTGQTQGSLLGVFLPRCHTAMGKRQLKHWLCYPLIDPDQIHSRQQVVESLVNDSRFADDLAAVLNQLHDVPRILGRLAVRRATPRDLVALGQSAALIQPLHHTLADRPALADTAKQAAELIDPLTELADTLTTACVDSPPAHLREGGLIADGHDTQLDHFRSLQNDAHNWLADYQKRLIDDCQLNSIKVGFNKVFGYYIELSAANKDKAPESWHRKQTLKNAERFITDELKHFEGEVLSAESRAIAREQHLFDQLQDLARKQTDSLRAFADLTADLDVLSAFAALASRHRYVRPSLVEDPVLHLTQARHPVLDQTLAESFVPNDLNLGPPTDTDKTSPSDAPDVDSPTPYHLPPTTSSTLALITGPNMAGKSTYIRQTALLTLLAHTGAFVPADAATIGLTDRIFTRVGSADELHAGQSTFMVEMTETANLCHHATGRSLVILDEIGRGTSTLDGLSLAWAIAEHLAARQTRTLFATHYHELTQLADTHANIANLHVTVREWKDDIVFLHQIAAGATDRSYGIHVAKIAGLPPSITTRANDLLQQLAVNHHTPPTKPAAPETIAASDPMPLFTEMLEHPIVDQLRQLDLNQLTPMQAFDALRQLQQDL
ncbi:MAG: DNA mismatch repair protein MutS [Planctomycetota bacterium]